MLLMDKNHNINIFKSKLFQMHKDFFTDELAWEPS